MALVKYGGGIVQMAGSLAGNTYARNRYGNYNRARTKPVNPNSSRQSAIRTLMSNLAHVWSNTLTSAQRDAWNEYANNIAMTNRLGETVYLSGFNHFCRSNAALLNAGLAQVNDAPTTFALPDTDDTATASYDSATQEISIAFDDAMDWLNSSGAGLCIFQGKPVSAGINFFAGPWRFADSIDGDDASPPSTPATMDCAFTIGSGQLIYTQARICLADGRVSEFFRLPAATAS